MNNIDANTLERIIYEGKQFLESRVDHINSLNVFPVPDGDTGTNLFLTLRSVEEELVSLDKRSIYTVSKAIARGALMGARGNSGVIMAQFLRGIVEHVAEKSEITPDDLIQGLSNARDLAYRAVSNPTEGTMLTIINDISSAALLHRGKQIPIQDLWVVICESANKSVAETPLLLPILDEAGVVDAGGFGLAVFLEGALLAIRQDANQSNYTGVDSIRTSTNAQQIISDAFIHSTEGEYYGYCTQFIITGSNLDIESIRSNIDALGTSNVVIGDDQVVRIHTHADDPGKPISYAISIGNISEVNIADMDQQNTQFIPDEHSSAEPLDLAIISIGSGDGIIKLLRESGSNAVINGGDSMNPSTKEILDSMESLKAGHFLLLPNNPNVVAAAEQASLISGSRVTVLPTVSIPQGIAALISFNPLLDPARNIENMRKAITSVKSGAICKAARSVQINNLDIRSDNFMGLLEREVVVTNKRIQDTSESLLDLISLEDSLVTLYWGASMDESLAEDCLAKLMTKYPDADFDLVYGGQHYYEFIISVE